MDFTKLNEWNPWWENKSLLKELEGKKRPKYGDLLNSINLSEISIITGIRRSGKSTLMYQMISNLLNKGINPHQILFINLEDKKFTKDTLEDIYQAYRETLNLDKKAYIFLDEIHKKKDWEYWVRKKYDLKTKDKFIISGSCSYLLNREYSTLLTGRNLTFEVFPLSFKEFLDFKSVKLNYANIKKGVILEKTKLSILKNITEFMNYGGFPAIVLKQKQYKMQVLKQYFNDIIFKDIIDRFDLSSKKTNDLSLFLITNFTSLISLRNLRNSIGLSYDTIKDYLNYFKEAFLFFSLDHFSYSLKEQKTLPSKIYCIDNGLRNAVSFMFSKDEGKLAENLVFLELKRRKLNCYYWKKKNEVDFIVKNLNNELIAINVTYDNDIKERELKGLLEFNKNFDKCKKLILITKDIEKKENNIYYIPLWKWLLME